MPDLKKLYTPKEATVLYNSNKIRFNPTSYTLKEHLILNRNLVEMSDETISSYDYRAEAHLLNVISNNEKVEEELISKIPTTLSRDALRPTEADCAAIKEYNLSIALDYLTTYGKISDKDIKNSTLMDAIVRMCVALDSVESCSREMYWLITNYCDRTYTELHNFEHFKKAFEIKPMKLPMCVGHNGIDVLYNDVSDHRTPSPVQRIYLEPQFRKAALYKAHFYAMEFLWAYYRLDDVALKRAIAWWVEHTGNVQLFNKMFMASGSELVVDKAIEDIVTLQSPADRFAEYQKYMAANDADILKWAEAMSPDTAYIAMNPVVAMFIGYAEGIAVTHVRVNTLAMLHTYCTSNGYIEASDEDRLNDIFEDAAGLGAMLGGAALGNDEKSLMDFDKNSGGAAGGGEDPASKYKGNNGIFEALGMLNADFEAGIYKFKVKDVRTADPDLQVGYEKICDKVKLLNRDLIRKIRDIKTYNTGGKNPGTNTGRLDRKAMYRYKYDPNIFYNNTYKQLESDLAFGIILDESGSMSGRGISDGKVTMIVLHETLKALGINHSIIGHTSHGGDYHCEIERYQSFREDKSYVVCKNYALAGITAHACNCDSGALYYMEKAMDRVQNRDKIVVIFSDGYPTACTSTDLLNQVHNMEKKGIKVIGVGIDFPSISKYYSEYANGRNLQDMLNIVTNILQEYILKKKVD